MSKEELFFKFATLFSSAPAEVRDALVAGYALGVLCKAQEANASAPT